MSFAQPKREVAAPEGGLASGDNGLVVVAVDPGSPAEKAGLRRGDILLKADKIELLSAQDLEYYVSRLKSGDSVALALERGGASRAITVELGERNRRPYLGVVVQGAPVGGGLGMRQVPGTDGPSGAMPRWSTPAPPRGTGVVAALVGEVLAGSPAEAAGIKQGDWILSADGVALSSGGSLGTEMAKRKPGDRVVLEVRRQKGALEKIEVTLAASAQDATKPYLGVRYQEVASGAPGLGLGRDPSGRTPVDVAGAVVVREVASGSPAEQAGIRAGDLIIRVGQDAVSLATPLADLVAKHKPGEAVEVGLVDRDGANRRSVTVTLGASPRDKERPYLGVVTGGRILTVPNEDQSAPRGRMRTTPRSGRTDT
jgi:S1-C subfamily serine protease